MDRKQKSAELIQKAGEESRNLLEHEVLSLLDAYEMPLPPFKFIPYGSELSEQILEGITYPVVLKVVSTDIVHKSDVGGVRLNLMNLQDVETAVQEMDTVLTRRLPDARISGWLLRSYIPEGTELIAGSITDHQLGPAVMAGIGGVFTEAYKDVSFRLVPMMKSDALEMLDELKGQAILNGLRGTEPLDRERLADFFVSFSCLISENPEIEECDLNPLICRGASIMIADARVKLRES